MENKTQFRSAGFGGFNRQDVLNYIEQTAAEHARQLEELPLIVSIADRLII